MREPHQLMTESMTDRKVGTLPNSEGRTRHLILHIGEAKVGSSSLQASLTSSMCRREPKRSWCYAVWNADGSFETVNPDTATRANSESWYGYAASQFRFNTPEWDQVRINGLSSLAKIFESFETVVASSETWITGILGLDKSGRNSFEEFLNQSQCDVSLVYFVRQQASWVQSAFLQWAIWQDTGITEFVERIIQNGRADWMTHIRKLDGLKGATLLPIFSNDVVSDFFKILGADRPGGNSSNRSMLVNELRLLFRNRELRVSADDSLSDFLLARNADRWQLPDQPIPWFIPRSQVSRIVEHHRSGNEELALRLDSRSSKLMLEDDKWWSQAAYPEHADLEQILLHPPTQDFLEHLATKLLVDARFAGPVDGIKKYRTAVRKKLLE